KPGVILAEIDFAYLESVRNQVMTLPNRRDDLYELALKKR
ncbi:MAG: carbon-nitrogen hydrolase family protein, partial [Xanthomonadaceae bacterium]|nr:carbon-nitrogen hydrolase family protein [Xanthomonadaceae bacterium]